MNRWSELFAPLVGRILVGGYFLLNGVTTCLNFPAAVQNLTSLGMPLPVVFTFILVGFEILGGVALVVGFKTRPAALAMALYALTTALLYINFNDQFGVPLFMQNMAIVGGLLYISAFGSDFLKRPRHTRT